MADLTWRPMRSTDLPGVLALAEAAHPLFPEEPEVFAEKQRLFAPFCFTLESDGAVAGYCIAHPWMRDRVPALNRLLQSPPETPDILFLHDIVVAPTARGGGASAALLEMLEDVAQHHGLNTIALVALYGSNRMWSRYGFEEMRIEKNEIKSYGTSAVYMQKCV